MKMIKLFCLAVVFSSVAAYGSSTTSSVSSPMDSYSVLMTADDDDDTDGENWDQILASYEDLVDKYISLVNKASEGDVSALAEYADYLAQAQKLSKKLAKGKGSMTAAQIKRYTRIYQKMMKAAQMLK